MIHVIDDYYVKINRNDFAVYKIKKVVSEEDGSIKEKKKSIGYHPSLSSALSAILSKRIQENIPKEHIELNQAIEMIKEMNNELLDSLHKIDGLFRLK